MTRTMKKLVAAAGGAAALLGGAYGIAQAWEALHLPRPAWNWELQRVQAQLEDTRARTLVIQRDANEQTIRDIEVLIIQLQAEGREVPPALYANKAAALDDIEQLRAELERLRERNP